MWWRGREAWAGRRGRRRAPWVFEADGIKELDLSGNRIGVVDTTGRASVKEGGLGAPWVFEADGIKELDLSE
jgi:hypothetical protein